MKNKLAVLLLSCIFTLTAINFAYGQEKPKLGILPFTGGTEQEGKTIASCIANQPDMRRAFDLIPIDLKGDIDSDIKALVNSKEYQANGYADSDIISRLGKMFETDYIVSGHVYRQDEKKFAVITIFRIEDFEQLAGDYFEYDETDEIPSLLPDITTVIISASGRDTSDLPGLAVIPAGIANEGEVSQEMEILTGILTLKIANEGKFVVLPRVSTMKDTMQKLEEQAAEAKAAKEKALEEAAARKKAIEEEAAARKKALEEEGTEGTEATDEETEAEVTEEEITEGEEIVVDVFSELGKSVNAKYVLYANITKFETMSLIHVRLINTEDGTCTLERFRGYGSFVEGIDVVSDLALFLTVLPEPGEIKIPRKTFREAMLDDDTKLWSVGASAGTSFSSPVLIGTVHGTLAPFKYTFFDVGCELGMICSIKGADYFSFFPFVHFSGFYPLSDIVGIYAGAGGGYLMSEYRFVDIVTSYEMFTANFFAGAVLFDFLNISYTLRTNFDAVGHKLAVGYIYRF